MFKDDDLPASGVRCLRGARILTVLVLREDREGPGEFGVSYDFEEEDREPLKVEWEFKTVDHATFASKGLRYFIDEVNVPGVKAKDMQKAIKKFFARITTREEQS